MDKITLESEVPLSQSKIWQYQTDYFEKKGVGAWVQEVPFYVTSNVVFAHAYARVLGTFLLEGWESGRLKKDLPVYILELGTGSGKFSFYCVSYLQEWLSKYPNKGKWCYVMSDFTRNNLDFWQQNSAFMPLVDLEVLDFSLYHAQENRPLYLENQRIYLENLENPLCIVANYFFDSIPQDFFSIENNQLFEQFITTSIKSEYYRDGHIEKLDALEIVYTKKPVNLPRYASPECQKLLMEYGEKYQQGSFLFPVGAFKVWKYLASLSQRGLCMISSDKGYMAEENIAYSPGATPSFHGSFSLMVYYPIIAEYIQNQGGDAYLDPQSNGLRIGIFLSQDLWQAYPRTAAAFEDHIIKFSTSDFLSLKDHLKEQKETFKLEELIALLKLAEWDTDLFLYVANTLMTKMETMSIENKATLTVGLSRLEKQLFFIPQSVDMYFELGRFSYQLGDLEKSVDYYQKSVEFSGGGHSPHFYNLGLSYYYLGKKENALDYFNRCFDLQPNFLDINQWVEKLKKELA